MNKKDFYTATGLDDQGKSMELDDQGLDGLDDQCNAMDRVEMFFHIRLHPLLANVADLKQNMNYSEQLTI